ncbi:MAG: peptidylprolyl isomerase [Gammaproteobacteria bacterium]|nr:peptidylprolyl isomerase [Gammaproteobacteria bacterium]
MLNDQNQPPRHAARRIRPRLWYVLAALLLTSLPALAAQPRARIETTLGVMVIELFADQAPATVANFSRYAHRGFYDDTLFHRVLAEAVIQGGGYREDYSEKPTEPPIINEADNGLSNVRGTLAMARTPDPHSATAQFFINLADNTPYDHRGKDARSFGYCVFGRVIEGMEVADAIGKVKVQARAGFDNNVPVEPVVITRLRLLKE